MGGERAGAQSRPTARSNGAISTRPNDPYDFDEISEHPIINAKVNGEDRKLVVHAARNGFFYALDRTNGSFVAGKQYVDQLELDAGPRSQDRPAAQLRSHQGRAGIRPGQPRLARRRRRASGCARRITAARTGSPPPTIRELNLLYIPSIEGCNTVDTVEQKDFVDQGGPMQAARAVRRRRQDGQPSVSTAASRRVDPATGETKARLKLEYPNYSGALATAGNLVFLGHCRRYVHGHDAKTLQELWSFNVGTGINAPAVTYSVNGKQYVAVLVGSRQALNVWQNAPS